MRFILAALLVTAALSTSAHAQSIADFSFENVDLNGNTYVYDPTDTGGWTFSGASGVSVEGTGNPWFSGPAADGSQAAFIQGNGSVNGEVSQTVTGLTVGTVYSLSFYLADREGVYGQYPVDPIAVSVGGTTLGTITPTSYSFVQYNVTFEATSTSETIAFFGTDTTPGDFDTNLDAVALSDIPEPAGLALLATGLAACGLVRARRRIA